jgi:hypothetical protein
MVGTPDTTRRYRLPGRATTCGRLIPCRSCIAPRPAPMGLPGTRSPLRGGLPPHSALSDRCRRGPCSMRGSVDHPPPWRGGGQERSAVPTPAILFRSIERHTGRSPRIVSGQLGVSMTHSGLSLDSPVPRCRVTVPGIRRARDERSCPSSYDHGTAESGRMCTEWAPASGLRVIREYGRRKHAGSGSSAPRWRPPPRRWDRLPVVCQLHRLDMVSVSKAEWTVMRTTRKIVTVLIALAIPGLLVWRSCPPPTTSVPPASRRAISSSMRRMRAAPGCATPARYRPPSAVSFVRWRCSRMKPSPPPGHGFSGGRGCVVRPAGPVPPCRPVSRIHRVAS